MRAPAEAVFQSRCRLVGLNPRLTLTPIPNNFEVYCASGVPMFFVLKNLKNGASRRLSLRIVSGRSTLFVVLVSQAVLTAQSGPQFDILIRNGHVVDGTGRLGTPATSVF